MTVTSLVGLPVAETRELTREAREADEAFAERRVLAEAYARHAPRVKRFLRDLLGDDALAWDATQETFARAIRHADILRDDSRAAPWLFGVARNVSLELRRSRFRASRVVDARGEPAERASASSPERDLLGKEAMTIIARAMSRLSEDRRAVLLLRFDHDLAYEQIAETMGWSLAKVKVEIFRARQVLREVMEQHGHGVDR